MLRWPTSELPIWPAGRPTRSSDASIVPCGQVASSRFQFGIAARVIALSGASARQPKPSRISSTTGRAAGRVRAGSSTAAGAGESVVDIGCGQFDGTRGRRAARSSITRLRYHFTFHPTPAPPPDDRRLPRQELDPRPDVRPVRRDARSGRSSRSGSPGARDINTLGATQLINAGNPLLLDLREPKEFDGRTLPNAVHIPLSQLGRRAERAREVRVAAGDRLLRSRIAQPQPRRRCWRSRASRRSTA